MKVADAADVAMREQKQAMRFRQDWGRRLERMSSAASSSVMNGVRSKSCERRFHSCRIRSEFFSLYSIGFRIMPISKIASWGRKSVIRWR